MDLSHPGIELHPLPLEPLGKPSRVITTGKKKSYQVAIGQIVVAIPGSGIFTGGGHSNPLQYSCLENPMDRAAWWAIVHMVTKQSDTEAT